MAEVQATLQAHLHKMQQRHAADGEALQEAARKLAAASSSAARAEEQIGDAQRRYTFFQELRVYLQDVLECMDVKAPALEDMEEQLVEAGQRRAEALRKRRALDLADRISDVEQQVAAAHGRAAPAAAAAELDEFGRDPSLARGRRMKERAARRLRTAERRRETYRGGGGGQQAAAVENLWTSDESDGEVAEYRKIRQELKREEAQLMADVKSEYKDVTRIYARLLEWRAAFPRQYREAYVGMSLPRLLAPAVRLQLLDWEPLADGKSLEEMQWVTALFQQQERAREAGGEGGVDEEDDELIPKIVAQVVVPKVAKVLEHAWDAGSTASTTHAVGLVQDVVVYVLDSAPDSVKALCATICGKLEAELARLATALGPARERDDTREGDALLLGQWAFSQCCKVVRHVSAGMHAHSIYLQTCICKYVSKPIPMPIPIVRGHACTQCAQR